MHIAEGRLLRHLKGNRRAVGPRGRLHEEVERGGVEQDGLDLTVVRHREEGAAVAGGSGKDLRKTESAGHDGRRPACFTHKPDRYRVRCVVIGGIALILTGLVTVALTYVVPSLRDQAEAGTANRQKLIVLPAIGLVVLFIGIIRG